jgi:hypothetical protein
MADSADRQSFLQLTQFQKRTLLFVFPPLVLSFLISTTILITQCVVIHLLDSHIKGNRVHYGNHSTLISLDAAPSNVLIATSIISGLLTIATAIGIWVLRHPTQSSNQRYNIWRGSTIIATLSNVFLALICVVVVFVAYAHPFRVYEYEIAGHMVRGTRETWLCSLQDRDGSAVGDVQRWGSIGCRMSAADRWLSVALLVLASMAFGIVVGIVLGTDKSAEGYEPVSTHDEDEDE